MEQVSCDICGSSQSQLLHGRGRNNQTVHNVICQQCGLVFISPRLEAEELAEHYKQGEFSVQARGQLTPDRSKIQQSEKAAWARFTRLHDLLHLDNYPAGHCLEIGCGVGSFLRLMQAAGWQVTGLEPDGVYAAHGQALYQLPIHADLLYEEYPAPATPYQLITAFHVLEHVRSPRRFLQKAAEELADGGLLYLEIPTIDKPYGGNLDRFFWQVHLYSFSQATLKGLLENLGFRLLAADYVGDFLWVVAEKTGEPRPCAYPLDPPNAVYQRVKRAHRAYQWRQKVWPLKAGYQAWQWGQKAITTYRQDPAEAWAGVRRLSQRAQLASSNNPLIRRPLRQWRGRYIVHYGMHIPVNAGDTVLFQAVRETVEQLGGRGPWLRKALWEPVTAVTLQQFQQEARAILIGGGGVFLKDTNPNQNSGWQWNCPPDLLRQIKLPIILFAVGYNRFRGQEEFDDIFTTHIQQLVSQAAFIGLRNHGSIRNLAAYLAPEQQSKLSFQPCPTTHLAYLHPEFAITDLPQLAQSRRLALNMAFDRHSQRFGNQQHQILPDVARALHHAVLQEKWDLHYVIHTPEDATFIPYLLAAKVPHTTVNLYGRPYAEVLRFYQTMPLTLGMRGHSQMIPFGQGGGIISLISHDKLRYFLEDIGHLDWGIELNTAVLTDELISKIAYFADNVNDISQQITQARAMLWQVTQQNWQTLAPFL
jgi:SAM-dependent methyltransferase/polysaccharide pyruvyl transferase WcaK-like protein